MQSNNLKVWNESQFEEIRDRKVYNGFDYYLQVWVEAGIILDCNHPLEMKKQFCCNQHKLAGYRIADLQGAEVRP